jgi:hypothetical protein
VLIERCIEVGYAFRQPPIVLDSLDDSFTLHRRHTQYIHVDIQTLYQGALSEVFLLDCVFAAVTAC